VKLIAITTCLLAASFALLATACHKNADAAGKLSEIKNLGSDTMLEVAGAWAEAYQATHKTVPISVSGGGSGKGISSLIDGAVDIANCSRQMKDSEVAEAKKHGHSPVQHTVGYDGIAIYVNRDNPVETLTLEQLKAIFGDGGKVTKWSDLGIKLADAKADPIVLVSRQNNSGTYEYFREAVLGGDKGRFKAEANNLNGSKDVVDFVAKTPSAIGYSGLAYATPAVRMVPIVGKDGKAIAPSIDSVINHTYPIARPLFMYTIGEPQGAVKDYLDWILGDDGQRVLQQKGYPPLRTV
jgi:phosphate transport system substrate-binding protein